MALPSIKIRELQESDLTAVVELFNLRDSRQYSLETVRHIVYGGKGSSVCNWLALVDGKPVGLTGWAVRELRQGSNYYRAGYWQNLFVHPDYRRLMLYPQLVFAMFKGAQQSGLDFIYNANRRPQLWQAHVKLGFVNIGDLAVLAKPLRPARLVRKSKELPGYLDFFGQPIDRVYSLYLQAQIPWDGDDLEDLCILLADDADTRLHQVMTVESLRARYQMNLEEEPYRLLGIKAKGRLVAALIYRTGLRGNQIYAGVIMDLLVPPGAESYAQSLLSAAETDALKRGCEVMLYLDGLGQRARQLMKRCGYFKSPEQYVMLVWPKSKATEPFLLSNLEDWRFAFGDHDAF